MRLTPGTVAFACHEKACAPPPAGTGGSSRKAGSSKAGGNPNAEHNPEGHARDVARLAANKQMNLDRRTQAAYDSAEQEVIGEYKAARSKGDLAAMTKAVVEWAGVRAERRRYEVGDIELPDAGERATRWFMGPPNKKGRNDMYLATKEEAAQFHRTNKPKPLDDKPRVTKYH